MIVTHDKNWQMIRKVLRGHGHQSTSFALWWNSILIDDEATLLEKWCFGEVSNHKNLRKTHFRAQWELSNATNGSSNWDKVWSQRAIEKLWIFQCKDVFPPIWIHLLSELWWIWRGEKGPKSCGDLSGQIDRQNQDLRLLGRWPYSSL